MSEKVIGPVDLRVLTHKGFLRLGVNPGYLLRRTPRLRVKQADGKTEVLTCLMFNWSVVPTDEKFPKEGDLLWVEEKKAWCLLEKGYLRANLEFQSGRDAESYQNGDEVFCLERPWPVVLLREDTEFINRSGSVVEYGYGDYVAESSQVPLRFTLIPYSLIETGGYEIV